MPDFILLMQRNQSLKQKLISDLITFKSLKLRRRRRSQGGQVRDQLERSVSPALSRCAVRKLICVFPHMQLCPELRVWGHRSGGSREFLHFSEVLGVSVVLFL